MSWFLNSWSQFKFSQSSKSGPSGLSQKFKIQDIILIRKWISSVKPKPVSGSISAGSIQRIKGQIEIHKRKRCHCNYRAPCSFSNITFSAPLVFTRKQQNLLVIKLFLQSAVVNIILIPLLHLVPAKNLIVISATSIHLGRRIVTSQQLQERPLSRARGSAPTRARASSSEAAWHSKKHAQSIIGSIQIKIGKRGTGLSKDQALQSTYE